MNLRRATPQLVAQRVRKALQDSRPIEVLAMRAEPAWTAGPLTVDTRRVDVRPCVSPLAVRATLSEWEMGRETGSSTGDILVLLCDLSDRELGDDLLARLSRAQVLSLDPWDAARARFGVTRVDAAFTKDDRWIAEALLNVPDDVVRVLGGGTTLTVELALTALARHLLGADDIGVDAILRAAASSDPFPGLGEMDAEARDGLLDKVAAVNGPLGTLVASVLRAGHGADLLAMGLAARAVYGDGSQDGGRAAGRLESRCGADAIDPPVGAALAERCEERVTWLLDADHDRANAVIAAASALVAEVDARSAEASALLPEGFDRRLRLAVDQLAAILDALGSAGGPEGTGTAALAGAFTELRDAIERVADHRGSTGVSGRRRFAHLEMAGRLAAWLAVEPMSAVDAASPAGSFGDSAAAYVADGAWVDRARRRLWKGDDDGDVGEVYRRLIDLVVARRREQNRHFAETLAAWTSIPAPPEALAPHGLVPVEAVVETVLARFTDLPVLFVVLDGCGLASFGELAPQFSGLGFREIARGGTSGSTPRRLSAVATLPTVTEVSRASLIAGAIDKGNQDHERRAFEANPAIKKDGGAAALFHQNRLAGPAGTSLSVDLGKALGPGGPAVVGVVINTIDDNLKRGTFTEELALEDLHSLVSLLEAARTHGRVVVVSADHGHVLAQPDDGGTGTFQGGGSGGERWRAADRLPSETEVLLRGPRVHLGDDAGVLAPWEDDYRYGAKAGGYHGGATPEEVLVPLAAYLPAGMDPPKGWEIFVDVPPLWWDLVVDGSSVGAAPALAAATKPRRKPTKRVDKLQPAMFDLPAEKEAAPSVPAAAVAEPAWVAGLLASEVWQVQKKAVAGRTSLPDDRVRAVLTVASRRGGVASFAELSAGTGLAGPRLPGFLSVLGRVLNVDGYSVLEVDATIQEVRLSLVTLGQQFGVDVSTA